MTQGDLLRALEAQNSFPVSNDHRIQYHKMTDKFQVIFFSFKSHCSGLDIQFVDFLARPWWPLWQYFISNRISVRFLYSVLAIGKNGCDTGIVP